MYLHYAYDLWAHHWRQHQAHGDMVIVRYADDAVAGFENEDDAKRFLKDLQGRLSRFELELNRDKTVLVEFRQQKRGERRRKERQRSRAFTFLGLEHYWGRTTTRRPVLVRRTEPQRMRATLKAIKIALRRRRHDAVPEQGEWLGSLLRGYFNYYAVPTNVRMLSRFRTEVIRLWRRQLQQRSQRTCLNWRRMNRLSLRWLPPAKARHPWPQRRFHART